MLEDGHEEKFEQEKKYKQIFRSGLEKVKDLHKYSLKPKQKWAYFHLLIGSNFCYLIHNYLSLRIEESKNYILNHLHIVNICVYL